MKYRIDIEIPEPLYNIAPAREDLIATALLNAASVGGHLVRNQWKALRDANGELVGKITRTE